MGALGLRVPDLISFAPGFPAPDIFAWTYYHAKRRVMERALGRELGDLVSWPQPKGGFFLWASFASEVDTDALLDRAVAHGVVYVAGSAFFVDGRRSSFARLAFSAPSHERIEEGIRRLAKAVREHVDRSAKALGCHFHFGLA